MLSAYCSRRRNKGPGLRKKKVNIGKRRKLLDTSEGIIDNEGTKVKGLVTEK